MSVRTLPDCNDICSRRLLRVTNRRRLRVQRKHDIPYQTFTKCSVSPATLLAKTGLSLFWHPTTFSVGKNFVFSGTALFNNLRSTKSIIVADYQRLWRFNYSISWRSVTVSKGI